MTRDKLLKLVGRERRHSCSRRYGLGCLPFHLDRSWQSLGPCRRDSLVEVIRARSGTLYERGCMLVAIKMSDSHRKRHLRTVLCTPRYRLRPLQSRSSHSMPSLHSVKGKRNHASCSAWESPGGLYRHVQVVMDEKTSWTSPRRSCTNLTETELVIR